MTQPDPIPAPVRSRKVFYIPGYDPIHPRRYRELYRSEGAAQAAISGYALALKPKTTKGRYGWHVSGAIDGAEVEADVEVLVWSDLVRGSMAASIPATYLATCPHRLDLYRLGRAAPADVAAQGAGDRRALPGGGADRRTHAGACRRGAAGRAGGLAGRAAVPAVRGPSARLAGGAAVVARRASGGGDGAALVQAPRQPDIRLLPYA